MIEKVLAVIKKLIGLKFTGCVEISFNQGGIHGVKIVKRENVIL